MKLFVTVMVALVALLAAGCASSSSSGGGTATQAEQVTGKVTGKFVTGGLDTPLDEAGLLEFITTSDVYCGWQGGKVIVHVTMKNTSTEHVTVNWYPRYKITGGGIHGAGFSAAESDGFESGEQRELVSKQEPKGVTGNPPIQKCFPAFQLLESG